MPGTMVIGIASPHALRLRDAARYCGISPSLLRKLDRAGVGPRKTRLTERAVAWLIDDLDAWITARRYGGPAARKA